MKIIFVVFSVLLLWSFHIPSVNVHVTGHLRSKTHKKISGVYVFVKGALPGFWGSAVADKNGDFILEFNDSDGENVKPISFYYVNSHRDTVLLKNVFNIQETSEITFWIK